MIVRIVVQVILHELLTRFHSDLQLMPLPGLRSLRKFEDSHETRMSDVGSEACASCEPKFRRWDICVSDVQVLNAEHTVTKHDTRHSKASQQV